MNLLTYKDYAARVEFDARAAILFGQVMGLQDVITFEGETVAEVEQAFRDSVDDYLAFCAEQGRQPEKPYSGNLPFRTTPDLHRLIVLAATRAGTSVNAYLTEVAREAVQRDLSESAIPDRPPGS